MSLRRLVPLSLAAALISGCIHTGFSPTTTLRLPRRRDNCHVDVILQGNPPYPYVVIGRVSTDGTAPDLFAVGENEQVALQRLKVQACRAGAHLMINVDTGSDGKWNGDGYSKSTRGTAVVGVYVDPDGNPFPPPSGPRTIVHMPDGSQKVVPAASPQATAASPAGAPAAAAPATPSEAWYRDMRHVPPPATN